MHICSILKYLLSGFHLSSFLGRCVQRVWAHPKRVHCGVVNDSLEPRELHLVHSLGKQLPAPQLLPGPSRD